MNFLDKTSHDSWVDNQLPKLQNSLYGFNKGEYISSDTSMKSNDFPIIDSRNTTTNNRIFRTIIKLTHDYIPDKYEFSKTDLEIIEPGIATTFQVVIIQVDKDLCILNKGHYPMNSNIM